MTSLDVSCALHGIQVGELKDGGREVGELLGAGLPLELASSKNPFIESLKELVPQLVPERLRLPELQKAPVESEKRRFSPESVKGEQHDSNGACIGENFLRCFSG